MPEPNVDAQLIEQARRQVNRLAEEIAQLSEANLAPPEYYGEFLQRLLQAIAAPAGAIWVRSAQGNLVLQYQTRMREVGLDDVENGRQIHDELLRQAVMKGQPVLLPPQSGLGMPGDGTIAPGNPTNYMILIAPILVDKQVAGMVEVWQDPNRGPDAQRGFLQFMIRMAALAANYTRNHQLRQMSSQQQVWAQLETFAKQVHGSLNPTEVAYLVANEGRRLVECDRISVGIREGGTKCVVRAISGADVVEKRSNLVKLMRVLFDAVLQWGEKLVYSGSKDESLPPRVLHALDDYLAESNSKLLVVMPLKDEREKNSKRPGRSVILMECFEPQVAPEQLTARLEVVAKHATTALFNAWEYRKMPFRFIWGPLAKVQDGLGGKAKAILTLITFAVFALITALVVVPYPLKIDSHGQLMPKKWQAIYAPAPGQVVGFWPGLDSGAGIRSEQYLVKLHSLELEKEILELEATIANAQVEKDNFGELITRKAQSPQAGQWGIARAKADALLKRAIQERESLQHRYNADMNRPGEFWAKAPLNGIVLSHDFKKMLLHRFVQPNEPLFKAGYVGPGKVNLEDWEIELKIPQKHVGQVLGAFKTTSPDEELDVDFLLKSRPTEIFKGKLARKKIAPEATPDRTDNNEAQPVVIGWVRVSGKDIEEGRQLPPAYLLTGTDVSSRIRCGNHAMGYSLFYGVWEFIYERIVFFF